MLMSNNVRLDEEQSTMRRARVLGYDYIDTSLIADKALFKEILTNDELYKLRVIPLQADAHNILFGITTTTSQQTIAMIQARFQDQRIQFAIISDTGYADYMRLYNPPEKIIYHDIDIKDTTKHDSIDTISEILEQVRADDMLAYLVSQAHLLNASDVHIETQPDRVRIRFRIDGVLHIIANLSLEKYRILIAAIASAGNVSTSADEAQQGHIAHKVTMADGRLVDVNVRLETVPTINQMDVVMRLFNMDANMYTLDRLGLSAAERSVVDEIIAKPSGLVMIVGPTGSGKTTTLYSMLNTLNTEARKIITIEDPVEYQFPGITQISVKSSQNGQDTSFGEKLRAVLRLDPDVVMVGEIRDMDTAKTALQSALTGHLVLSTFHASSASAALTRLADVVGKNPLLVSAIRLIMAQRLIRKLDETTRIAYLATPAELKQISSVIETLSEQLRPNLDNLQLYKPGVTADNPYGFKGQMAIREQFVMTDSLRKLLENPNDEIISTQQIETAAVADGLRTMMQDAMLKVVAGETTLEEVFRVVG